MAETYARDTCSTSSSSRSHHEGRQQVSLLGDLALLLRDGGLVLSITLQQHSVVVVQLLLVQLVGCPHGLQMLLQRLNVCLQPASPVDATSAHMHELVVSPRMQGMPAQTS